MAKLELQPATIAFLDAMDATPPEEFATVARQFTLYHRDGGGRGVTRKLRLSAAKHSFLDKVIRDRLRPRSGDLRAVGGPALYLAVSGHMMFVSTAIESPHLLTTEEYDGLTRTFRDVGMPVPDHASALAAAGHALTPGRQQPPRIPPAVPVERGALSEQQRPLADIAEALFRRLASGAGQHFADALAFIPVDDGLAIVRGVRGGGSILVAADGSVLYSASAQRFEDAVRAFRAGDRTPLERFGPAES